MDTAYVMQLWTPFWLALYVCGTTISCAAFHVAVLDGGGVNRAASRRSNSSSSSSCRLVTIGVAALIASLGGGLALLMFSLDCVSTSSSLSSALIQLLILLVPVMGVFVYWIAAAAKSLPQPRQMWLIIQGGGIENAANDDVV